MSFDATTWVEDLGFQNSFGIYSGALGIASLGLPVVYLYGKRIRAFTAGKLDRAAAASFARRHDRGSEEGVEARVHAARDVKG